MTLTTAGRLTVQQQALAGYRRVRPAPPALLRRFTVWNGVTINRAYQSVADVAGVVWGLVPSGGTWDEIEWLVKAGEAGTYQAAWDSHPLAISSPDKLTQLINDGRSVGLRVTPYVVVRGNPEWRGPEVRQVQALVQAAGRCVLNLEPGSQYAHPEICSPGGAAAYLHDLGLPAESLELCTIPRAEQVRELGGPQTLEVWLSGVKTASWETYGLAAPTSLRVDIAIPYLEQTFPGILPEQCIPVVQKPEIGTWAQTPWATPGLQVWHLDGSI